MAGFMSGFGPAFADSFNAGLERNERRRQDNFKVMYQEYLDRKEDMEERKKQDAQNVKLAKSLVETTGAPEQAWTKAYEWLSSGMKADFVAERLQTGSFAQQAKPEGPDQVDTEMTATGMVQQPEPMETPSPSQQIPTRNTNPIAKALGLPDKFARDRSRSMDRLTQTTGRSEQEINSIMSGRPETPFVDTSGIKFTPGAPEREPDKFNTELEIRTEFEHAKVAAEQNPTPGNVERLKAAQRRMSALSSKKESDAYLKSLESGVGVPVGGLATVTSPETGQPEIKRVWNTGDRIEDKDGNVIEPYQVMSPDQIKDYDEVAEATGKKVNEYLGDLQTVHSVMHDIGEIGQLLSEDPGTQARWVNAIADFAQEGAFNFLVAKDILTAEDAQVGQAIDNVLQGGEADPRAMTAVNSMEERLNSLIGSGLNDQATKAALYNTKIKILAYKLAAMRGQEGRGLSETERAMFEELASGGITPEKFYQNMASLMNSDLSEIDQTHRVLQKYNTARQRYEQKWQMPYPQQPVPSVEEFITKSDDQFVNNSWKILRESGLQSSFNPPKESRPVNQPQGVNQPQAAPTARPQAINPKTGEVLEWNGTEWIKAQ